MSRLPIVKIFEKPVFSLIVLGFLAVSGLGGCSSSSSEADPDPVVSIATASVTEGDGGTQAQQTLDFVVTSTKASTTAITLTYTITAGTATAGVDYTDNSGTVDIPANTTSVTISVPVIGDTDIEDDETLTLTLSAPSGASLGTATATGTIVNDDHADPKGYYTGSAAITDPSDGVTDIVLNDLKVMVSGNRMMMMSLTGALLYDAQITSISGESYTADATTYIKMDESPDQVFIADPIQTSITGTIVEGSRIEGTITGSVGAATGTFTADYNSMSDTIADSTDIANTWSGYINNRNNAIFKFSVDGSGLVTVGVFDFPDSGVLIDCSITSTYNNSMLPVSSEAVFSIDLDLVNCENVSIDGTYTGFAIPKSLANDTLVFQMTNGSIAAFAEFTVVP